MAMRKDWQSAKSLAEFAFKKDHPVQGDVHINPPAPYPVKFKEDLGPTLDDYEKAKTATDKAKYARKAKDVIKNYRASITTAKDMKTAGKVLLDALAKIEKALV
jgi:hypothetical protein